MYCIKYIWTGICRSEYGDVLTSPAAGVSVHVRSTIIIKAKTHSGCDLACMAGGLNYRLLGLAV
jgi:hypothetical protein